MFVGCSFSSGGHCGGGKMKLQIDVVERVPINITWTLGANLVNFTPIGTLDTVIFKFNAGSHNVYQFLDEEHFTNCNFTEAQELSDSGAADFMFVGNVDQTVFFGCSINGGVHCTTGGMKVKIVVGSGGNTNTTTSTASTSSSTSTSSSSSTSVSSSSVTSSTPASTASTSSASTASATSASTASASSGTGSTSAGTSSTTSSGNSTVSTTSSGNSTATGNSTTASTSSGNSTTKSTTGSSGSSSGDAGSLVFGFGLLLISLLLK